MPWRPLSKRGVADPRLDEPVEGLPPYLQGPVVGWVLRGVTINTYTGERADDRAGLQALQLELRLDPPLDYSGRLTAAESLANRMASNDGFALDVVDYLLGHPDPENFGTHADRARELGHILTSGGSVWEVTELDDAPGWQLTRRAVGPVREAILGLPASSRSHKHLVTAWNQLSSRDPNPSSAYKEAVRAVEAAAKAIVLPSNERATLGQMIAALRDKPQKWTVALGTVEDVRRMMEMVWTGQLDRHGTDDQSVPLTVSQEQADTAFHICLTLARLFAGGLIAAAP